MINISKIDPHFNIYKNNSVIIWGDIETILEMIELFKFFDINIAGICEEKDINAIINPKLNDTINLENQNKTLIKIIKNIPVISQSEVKDMFTKDNNLTVQVAMNSAFEMLILAKIQMIGIQNYICTQEALNFLGAYKKVKNINENPNLNDAETIKIFREKLVGDISDNALTYISKEKNTPLFLCLPPKTGDNTLENTFKANKIESYNYWHTPKAFNKDKIIKQVIKKSNTIKIITAIREPIAQNFSLFYSTLTLLNYTNNNYLLKLFEDNKFLTENNRDAQTFFDIWLNETDYLNKENIKSNFNTLQHFIPEFQNNILDIMKYPFDTEKGYSIIREKIRTSDNINQDIQEINIEIFTYQLEKMNDLLDPMNEWLGCKFNNWIIGNTMDNKWIADSYKQAIKDIKFSKEYFEKCYNEDYVNHFYSKEDIEKFKNKYKYNIN